MNLKEFFKSKYFFTQLILAGILAIVILWLSLKFLDIYTLHGQTIEVPDLEGLYKEDVITLLEDRNLNYDIHDSIYDPEREKETVAAQDPLPGINVKRGRTIYLTMVARLPEKTVMPQLTDLSLRHALTLLETHGLKVGKLEYVPNIAKNAVLEQKYKHGTIKPGTKIEKGTPIDLVLGKGLTSEKVPVPFVIGMTREEALMEINRSSLNIGEEEYLDNDSVNVKVYQQRPDVLEKTSYLKMQSTVDLYYRSADDFDFDSYMDEIMMVEIPLLYGKSPEEARDVIKKSSLKVGDEVFEKNATEEDGKVYEQKPDYFEQKSIKRGSKINLWYRTLEDFDDDL